MAKVLLFLHLYKSFAENSPSAGFRNSRKPGNTPSADFRGSRKHSHALLHRIKFLFELGQVFVIGPIEVMHIALLVKKTICWIAC